MKIFITQILKNKDKFEGPRINATCWIEAELIASHLDGVILIGELD